MPALAINLRQREKAAQYFPTTNQSLGAALLWLLLFIYGPSALARVGLGVFVQLRFHARRIVLEWKSFKCRQRATLGCPRRSRCSFKCMRLIYIATDCRLRQLEASLTDSLTRRLADELASWLTVWLTGWLAVAIAALGSNRASSKCCTAVATLVVSCCCLGPCCTLIWCFVLCARQSLLSPSPGHIQPH